MFLYCDSLKKSMYLSLLTPLIIFKENFKKIKCDIFDKNSNIEIGHVVRSFDPCISCSIHAIGNKKQSFIIEPSN